MSHRDGSHRFIDDLGGRIFGDLLASFPHIPDVGLQSISDVPQGLFSGIAPGGTTGKDRDSSAPTSIVLFYKLNAKDVGLHTLNIRLF
jgi:hypothetical protein